MYPKQFVYRHAANKLSLVVQSDCDNFPTSMIMYRGMSSCSHHRGLSYTCNKNYLYACIHVVCD